MSVGAAVSIWAGWVGLGHLAGFGKVVLLPGVWDTLRIDGAVVLPLSVEAYGAYALRVWLSAAPMTRRTRQFAARSAIGSLCLGALSQILFHLLTAAGYTRTPWPIVIFVAIIPVVVLGLASCLARLVANERGTRASTGIACARAATALSGKHWPRKVHERVDAGSTTTN